MPNDPCLDCRRECLLDVDIVTAALRESIPIKKRLPNANATTRVVMLARGEDPEKTESDTSKTMRLGAKWRPIEDGSTSPTQSKLQKLPKSGLKMPDGHILRCPKSTRFSFKLLDRVC